MSASIVKQFGKFFAIVISGFAATFILMFLFSQDATAATTDYPHGTCIPSVQGAGNVKFARMECRGYTAHNYGRATAECTFAPNISTAWIRSGEMAQSTVCWWGADSAYSSYKL